MAGSMIDHVVWATVVGDGHFNPDGAIYRYWRSLKSADPPQYLGVPVTVEIDVGNDTVQQGFASGAVIQWNPGSGAELAND